MPLISVVIPAYNAAGYISKTLESVLSQTWSDYEVIVSDDGSTDDTLKVVKKKALEKPERKVRIIECTHRGPGAARNAGIEAASGEWVSFLDSDDVWFPDKLNKVAGRIRRNKADLYCHSEVWADTFGEVQLDHGRSFDRTVSPFLSLYRRNALSTSAVTLRKEMLLRAGLFDTTLPAGQDYDLWLRVALLPGVRFEFLDEPLGVYVTREGNISSDVERWLGCMIRIGRKYAKELTGRARFPALERLRYEGRVYTGAGMRLLRKKRKMKGIFLLSIGTLKWPPGMASRVLRKI